MITFCSLVKKWDVFFGWNKQVFHFPGGMAWEFANGWWNIFVYIRLLLARETLKDKITIYIRYMMDLSFQIWTPIMTCTFTGLARTAMRPCPTPSTWVGAPSPSVSGSASTSPLSQEPSWPFSLQSKNHICSAGKAWSIVIQGSQIKNHIQDGYN